MKPQFLPLVSLLFGGCAQHIDTWVRPENLKGGEVVTVKGWLHIPPSGGIFLCDGILLNGASAASCLDVVFKSETINAKGVPRVIFLKGTYRRYPLNLEVVGHRMSEIGIIEEAVIDPSES